MKFASAGDRVTCENGHHICTVARDLETNETITASMFKDWQIDIDLNPGAAIPNCPDCGSPFIAHPSGKFPKGAKVFIKWWVP